MEPSQRQLRVGEIVRHAVSEVFSRGEVRDPALEAAIITVPEVRMSPDLKVATVLVMPLGGRAAAETIAGLNREKGFIRNAIKRRVNLRFLPDLRFVLDTRFDDDDKINRAMRQPDVAADLAHKDTDDDSPDGH